MWPLHNRLLNGQVRSRADSCLPAPTGNMIRSGQVPISIYDKERAGDLLSERVSPVHTHHEVRREIGAPRSGVVEIVFGVE